MCSACNTHFFGHQVLILFWTHLPCFFITLSVCMPGMFCSAAFWLVRIAYCGRLGLGAEKNRAIKRFRNRAISNRDFISISINRTALHSTQNRLATFLLGYGHFCARCTPIFLSSSVWPKALNWVIRYDPNQISDHLHPHRVSDWWNSHWEVEYWRLPACVCHPNIPVGRGCERSQYRCVSVSAPMWAMFTEY